MDTQDPVGRTGHLRAASAVGIAILMGYVHMAVFMPRDGDFPTPYDRSNPTLAAEVRLLERAALVVPRGECYTVRAQSPDAEMQLFMLSLGILSGRSAFPLRYWGFDTKVVLPDDHWIIVFGEYAGDLRGSVVAKFPEGSLLSVRTR